MHLLILSVSFTPLYTFHDEFWSQFGVFDEMEFTILQKKFSRQMK